MSSASAVNVTRTIAAGMPASSPMAGDMNALNSRDRTALELRPEQEVRHGRAADVAHGARLYRVARARDHDELPVRSQGELLPRPGELRRQVVAPFDEQRGDAELPVRLRRRPRRSPRQALLDEPVTRGRLAVERIELPGRNPGVRAEPLGAR